MKPTSSCATSPVVPACHSAFGPGRQRAASISTPAATSGLGRRVRLKSWMCQGRFGPGLKAVMQLQPIRYEYKLDNALRLKSEGEHIGFGAQSLQKIIPEAVTKNSEGYLMVNNDPIIWTMLNAIKEQQKEIAEL